MKALLRIQILVTVSFGVFSAVLAEAATYYVKPTGNDSADGLSNATAWATIAKVNSTPLVAGDQVLFRAGSVFRDATLVPSGVGTATNRIFYGAYGTGAKPILTTAIVLPSTGWTSVGADVYSRVLPTQTRMVTVNNSYMVRAASVAALSAGQYFWDAATTTLYVKDLAGSPNTTGKIYEAAQRDHVVHANHAKPGKPYQTFSGLRFEKSNLGLAVLGSYANYYTFENCEFFFASSNQQFASAGVLSNVCDGLRVVNSRLAWLEGDGIYAQSGANVELIGNEIDHLFDDGGDNGPDGIQINGLKRPADNFIVKDNIVRRETKTTNKGCIIVAGGSGGLISGNRVYMGAFGIAVYTKNTVVEYNYCEDIGYGDALRLWENLGQENMTVRYNVVNGCVDGSGVSIGNGNAPATPMPNVNIYNNLFYNTRYGATYGVASSGSFRNNIVWSPIANPTRRLRVVGIIPGETFISDNNLLQDQGTGVFSQWAGVNYYSLADHQAASEQDPNSVTGNPLWVDATTGDFRLQAGSPAIDSGASFGTILDYAGNPVPNGGATDMGPYEFGDLLAYEGFEYTTGALTSANGGRGWETAWTIAGGAGVTEILSGSHAWAGAAATGNRFRIYDTDGPLQEINRTLRKSFGAQTETYWVSFLVKKFSSGREASIDFDGFGFKATSGDWQVKTPATSYVAIPNSNYAGLHLIVARVDATASGDTVYVWVDPVVAAGIPSMGSAAVTVTDPGFTFKNVKIKHGPFGNASQSSEWDELRLGKTFNAVTSGL